MSVKEMSTPFVAGIRKVRMPFVVQCGLAVVTLLAFAYLLRGSAMHSAGVFNPDEAELLAEGRVASHHLLPLYGSYTSSTYLFLWPFLLGVLGAVGVHLTMPTAHVLSAFAYTTIFFVPALAIAVRVGWRWATVVVGPPFVVVLGQTSADFASLGTELLGLACIVVGAAIVLVPQRAASRTAALLAGALIGLAPWAKPQVGVLALTALAEVAVIGSLHSPRGLGDLRRVAGWVLIGAVTPSLVIIASMFAGGTFGNFLHDPVGFSLAYTRDRTSIYTGYPAPGFFDTEGGAVGFVLGFPLALLPLLTPVVCRNSAVDLDHRLRVALWLAPLAAALATLFGTYPLFPHYGNILYGAGALSGLSMAALSSARAATEAKSEQRLRESSRSGALALAVLSAGFMLMSGSAAIHSNLLALKLPSTSAADPALKRACPAGSRVFVWGSAAELYADQNWAPASRYVDPLGWVLSTTPARRYWVRTLVGDLKKRPPSCIVEVGAGFFASTAATPTLPEAVPTLAPWIRLRYTRSRIVTLADGRQVRLLRLVRRPIG